MEKHIEQFKQVAPHIVGNVKARLTGTENDAETLAIIHEEIVSYFKGWQKFFAQYMVFTEDQRRDFSGIMYDVVTPLAKNHHGSTNPCYEQFVKETGQTGALNFICHQLS